MSKLPRTILDEILERYKSLQHLSQPLDSIAVKAVAEGLRAYGYIVITRSLYDHLCNRPMRTAKEVANDDAPGY